jgi:hypothetical protein
MYFDYIAHPISQDLLEIIEKSPNAFISVFFEANYAEDFNEITEDCGQEIEEIGLAQAKLIYNFTQEILTDERKTLEIESENWLMPLHLFLSGEFSENGAWQEARPTFLSKTAGEWIWVNALLYGQPIKTAHQNMILTRHEDISTIINSVEKISTEDHFIDRWNKVTKNTGQYLDTFDQDEDRHDFVEDLEAFVDGILLPFLRICQAEQKHMLIFID